MSSCYNFRVLSSKIVSNSAELENPDELHFYQKHLKPGNNELVSITTWKWNEYKLLDMTVVNQDNGVIALNGELFINNDDGKLTIVYMDPVDFSDDLYTFQQIRKKFVL